MLCPNCSDDIPINQQYCPRCGHRLEVDFDHIEQSVAADAAARRAQFLGKTLINLVGVLVVTLVGLVFYNDYYRRKEFPADHSGSVSFPAPSPEVKEQGRLAVEVKAPVLGVPEVPRADPQGLTWRNDPVRERLRELNAGEFGGEAAGAVAAGLKYLVNRQQPDGGWLVSGVAEEGSVANDWGRCGVTALACLALMGDGHCWKAGEEPKTSHAAAVKRGLNFLTANQEEKIGRIGPRTAADGSAAHYMYNQGMATAALAEAYAMSGEPYLRAAAQKAVNFLLSAQQTSGGWGYYETPGSRPDASVTAWQMMALYSAHLAGLNVPALAIEKGLAFLDSLTEEETHRVGYERKWTPAEKVGHGSMAISLMLQLYLGRSASSAAARRQTKVLLTEALPGYDPKWPDAQKAEKLDYYTIYHATMAMQRLGGADWDVWNKATVKALTASQDRAGGSWPLYDKWSAQGGKVYATALAVMTLEVYYRYP